MTLGEQLEVLNWDTGIIIVSREGELYRGNVLSDYKQELITREVNYIYPGNKVIVIVLKHIKDI